MSFNVPMGNSEWHFPAHLFEEPKYREFLARHGIESLEGLNVIAKAKAVRRAARQQLRALRKSL